MMNGVGRVLLENTAEYPFHNSMKVLRLHVPMKNSDYKVTAKVVFSDCDPGEIVISDKARNGFKIDYTGNSKWVMVEYCLEEEESHDS